MAGGCFSGRMRPCLVVVALCLAMLTVGPASADTPSPAFRLLTYNIQGLPAIALNNESVYGMSDQRRGHEIAARIRTGNYDIVALQEVFDEDVRDALVADLRSTYPTMIEKFAGTTLFNEDSGLMLLSKFPIERMPPPPGRKCYRSDETASCSSAFIQYADRGGSDALADKGMGFTRLRNPQTSELVNVFLTHMQADDPAAGCPLSCASPLRAKQVRQQIDFINAWAPTGDTYVLGDMNIVAESTEYQGRILGDYNAAGFSDLWRTQNSALDKGISDSPLNSVNGPGATPQKLDYGLFRGGPKCVQYQKLEKFVFEGQIDGRYVASDLSDHYGIVHEVGPATDKCSPALAGTHPADGTGVAGSWFRFPDAGTYSLASDSGTLTVFRADDLSTPLTAFEGAGTQANPLIIAPATAFYVHVSSGSLYASRHTGASFADAIVLDPSQTLHQTSAGKLYYRFHQRKLTSGAKQALRLQTLNHPGVPLQIRLGDVQTPLSQPTATLALDPATSPVSGEEQNLSFTVEGAGTFDVRWESNYTHLSLRRIKVVDQNDTGGVDEPHLYVRVDGGAEREINLGDQDEGQAKILPAWARDLGFASSVTVKLREEDSGLGGGWDDYPIKTITPGPRDETLTYTDSSSRYDIAITATH
jgi:endonuclease/exonuclease/phosphatase family metal-dependent hydrolase